MSNKRRARQRKPDIRAGARLALLRSAKADGCICTAPIVQLNILDLTGKGQVVGNVYHTDATCPLFNAGPAAPHRIRDLVPEADLP